MGKKELYAEELLTNGLNLRKKDSLFISISSADRDFANIILSKANSIGVSDVYIFYNNIKHKNNHISEYIAKNAKFLFLVSEEKDDLNNSIINDIINEDLDIDYTVAPIASKTWAKDSVNGSKEKLETAIYHFASITGDDTLENWNNIVSNKKKVISKIKNLNLNRLKISTLCDTNLFMEYDSNELKSNKYNLMKLFPDYGYELTPVSNTTRGYISASNDVTINGAKIEELRMVIKDGMVVDYDCTSGFETAKKVLDVFPKPTISAVGLVEEDAPTYGGKFHNVVLDRTSNPYVLISSYNEQLDENYSIIVPIQSGTLKVSGINENGKNLTIYQNGEFTEKVKEKINKIKE